MKSKIKYYILLFLFMLNTSSANSSEVTGRIFSTITPDIINTGIVTVLEKQRLKESLVVSPDKGLANALVYIDKVNNYTLNKPAKVKMTQLDIEFVPRVIPVTVGTEIIFYNSDEIFHNVHGVAGRDSLFIINLTGQNQQASYKFKKEGLVSIRCEAHLAMQAYVMVRDNPYSSVTDKTGKYSIKGLTPGKYTLKVWHELLGEIGQKVTVDKNKTVTNNFTFKDVKTLDVIYDKN